MHKILEVSGLTRVHGPGCTQCQHTALEPDPEDNRCEHCGSIAAALDVSFDLYAGEILGIMGESGSGKSTLVKNLYFDDQPTAGRAVYHHNGSLYSLFELNAAQKRWFRYHCFGMVYQNPQLGLNFMISAGGNIAERLLMNNVFHYREIRDRISTLLERTQVSSDRMDELPGNFSGGMQQRVQIAKALVSNPPLLFLDEVTTGLDLSVQAKILDLILELQDQLQTTMIVVTHDLGVIRLLAGRTLVMKCGRVVESGLTDQILEDPQHPYTQRLVSSAL
ncbi:MAG: ATP-binding cassette domain-containing protein [Desulfovermiculus sp.]